jgi:hypothetical protein
MSEGYDNNMQGVIAKVISDNPRAPTMRVNVEIEGVKWKAGAWPMKRRDGTVVLDKNGNTLYKFQLEIDDYDPQAQVAQQQVKQEDVAFDDDIPF